jgi:hypothetical protein
MRRGAGFGVGAVSRKEAMGYASLTLATIAK